MIKRGPIINEVIRETIVPLAIEQELTSFKISIDAYEVAALDGWRGRARLPADTTSPSQLWDAIGKLACLEIDWDIFKTRLTGFGEDEVACRCGAHFVSGFLILHRWSLIVLGRQPLLAQASELLPVRTTTLRELALLLTQLDQGNPSPLLPPDPDGGGGDGHN
jgi:hypothetical protein